LGEALTHGEAQLAPDQLKKGLPDWDVGPELAELHHSILPESLPGLRLYVPAQRSPPPSPARTDQLQKQQL
jgi:hypothetical protein